ncbi:hypothetical protein EVAR_70075_1 [Eumeta japonica]|uniref:Uncharacterized protein n=1 Tax=Eumeta variegata TaxID=151549 RepID=A0A4C2A9Y3_EUMVA|nr:hypothetical protein EVAR_70075_1 [Eumeta japonica]
MSQLNQVKDHSQYIKPSVDFIVQHPTSDRPTWRAFKVEALHSKRRDLWEGVPQKWVFKISTTTTETTRDALEIDLETRTAFVPYAVDSSHLLYLQHISGNV